MTGFDMAIGSLATGPTDSHTLCQTLKIGTPRGAIVDVLLDLPAGNGPFPAIVLGPGGDYAMVRPALAQAARQLVARGIAVFRFNWAYYTQEAGHPSQDLALEVEDMAAVLSRARADPRIAGDKLFVGGKSLGSLVAWRLLQSNKDLRAAVMLTPICSSITEESSAPTPTGDARYPGAAAELRPLAFILGEQDPFCAVPLLYRFAAGTGSTSRVAVIAGDHSFEIPGLTASAATESTLRNTSLAGMFAADFIAGIAWR